MIIALVILFIWAVIDPFYQMLTYGKDRKEVYVDTYLTSIIQKNDGHKYRVKTWMYSAVITHPDGTFDKEWHLDTVDETRID